MLTEQEVSRTWGQLFGRSEIDEASLEKAENLLEELRPESPLRHRLECELSELRQLHTQ